jgi:hypothetical protein
MRTLFKVELPKREACCRKGGEPFAAGDECYSVISEGEGDDFRRDDYCPTCWEAEKIDLETCITHWKAKVPMRESERKECFQTKEEKALELLKTSLQSGEEGDSHQAFILALFLARQKVVALRKEVCQDSGEWLQLYEVLATEEMCCVKKVELSALAVAAIQHSLASKLR